MEYAKNTFRNDENDFLKHSMQGCTDEEISLKDAIADLRKNRQQSTERSGTDKRSDRTD